MRKLSKFQQGPTHKLGIAATVDGLKVWLVATVGTG